MAKFYAWSDLYGGGTTRDVDRPGGGVVTVVEKRNIFPRGEEVTKAKLKVSDEEWDGLIANGSVRDYPVPKEASETKSPAQAVLERMYKGTGEIDQNMLIEMAMKHPDVINPPSDEGKEVPVGV